MDETNTATSSSAAAVADGASAAAHTKTVGAAPIKSASHVKILIKSSNQQYEDHVIESDLLWTVKRLKSHLSVVYPSKPPAADQKLIYSGQLLNDNLLLKDVIRSYKDVYTHNHIIHLVYTPKNLPPPPATTNKTKTSNSTTTSAASASNMTSADGLRQRQNAGGNSAAQQSANLQQQQQQMFQQQMNPYFMAQQMMSGAVAIGGGMPCPQFSQNIAPGFAGHYMQPMGPQQLAMYSNWMQHVYSQYMEQCLRLSNPNSASNIAGPTMTPFPTFPPNMQNLFQQQFPTTVINPVVTEATAPLAPNGASAEQSPEERQDQLQQQQQQQPAQAQVAQPRFPNLQQDEQDNRDWLDNFFSITRLALFLTILYFNSSPLRCLVVVIIAGGIYLYHIGVLRFRNERNNNNLNRNNNAAQNAAVDQIRQGVDQQQNVVAPPAAAAVAVAGQENIAPENVANANNENNTPAAAPAANGANEAQPTTDTPENANNESMMSTIRTFVVTFFTSLLPETPAL